MTFLFISYLILLEILNITNMGDSHDISSCNTVYIKFQSLNPQANSFVYLPLRNKLNPYANVFISQKLTLKPNSSLNISAATFYPVRHLTDSSKITNDSLHLEPSNSVADNADNTADIPCYKT